MHNKSLIFHIIETFRQNCYTVGNRVDDQWFEMIKPDGCKAREFWRSKEL